MVTLSSFPFPPTKPNMLIKPKVFSITIENVSNRQLKTNESIEHLSKPGTPSDRADSNSRGGERSDVLGKIVQNLQLASGEDSSSSQPREGQSGASTTGGGTGAGDLQRSRHSSSDSSMASHTSAETDAKQSEAKFKYIFLLFFNFFHFFSFFSHFFHFFLLFFAYFSFRFDFFAYFSLILLSFSLQIFGVSHRCESCEIRLFFRFQAKRNFRFNFKFRFRSESEGAP